MAAAAVAPSLDALLRSPTSYKVEDDPMRVWDKGVFLNELLRLGLALSQDSNETVSSSLVKKTPLQKGTYKGTKMALTELYSWLEEA